MNYHLLTVNRSGRAADSRPRLQFWGDWLTDIGFVNGVLVQSLPEPDGLVLNLCDRNITYSELHRATRERGGALNRAFISNTRTVKGLTFVTTGKHLTAGGLQFGDRLLAQYEYGCIRVRKIVGNVRLFHTAQVKKERTGEPAPGIFMSGDWLNGLGFTSDTLMTVAAENGCITFTAHAKEIIYSEIVKFARRTKRKLIQVSTKDGLPLIKLTGPCVAAAGFALGDIFAAWYTCGEITLQKFDPSRFDF